MDIPLYLVRESWIVHTAVRGVVFLSLLYVISPVLRRLSPSLSHSIVLTALTGVLLFPFLTAVLPTMVVPVISTAISLPSVENIEGDSSDRARIDTKQRVVSIIRGLPGNTQASPQETRGAASSSVVSEGAVGTRLMTFESWSGPFLVQIIFRIWLMGAVAVTISIIRGIQAAHRLAQRAEVIKDERWLSLMNECRRQFGIRRRISVRTIDNVAMPMVWGFRRPVLFVPRSLVGADISRMTMILFHELAHIARGDQLTRIFGRLSCAMNWFNPFVWRFYGILLTEQERACDRMVLTYGIRKSDYAAQLLAMARLIPRHGPIHTAALGMARPGKLEDRLKSILAQKPPSKENKMITKGLSFMIMCGIVVVFATVQPFFSESLQAESKDETQSTSGVLADSDDEADESEPIVITGHDDDKIIMIKKKQRDYEALEQKLDQAMETIEETMKRLETTQLDREVMQHQLEQTMKQLESTSFDREVMQHQLEQAMKQLESTSFDREVMQHQLEQTMKQLESTSFDREVMQQQLEQAMKQLESTSFDREVMQQQLEQAMKSLEHSREDIIIAPEMISDLLGDVSLDKIFTDEVLAETRAKMIEAGKSEENIERVLSKLKTLNIATLTGPGEDNKHKTIVIGNHKSGSDDDNLVLNLNGPQAMVIMDDQDVRVGQHTYIEATFDNPLKESALEMVNQTILDLEQDLPKGIEMTHDLEDDRLKVKIFLSQDQFSRDAGHEAIVKDAVERFKDDLYDSQGRTGCKISIKKTIIKSRDNAIQVL